MALRSFGFFIALLIGGVLPCRAQLPSGPATLEKLLNEDGLPSAEQPAADANQPAADSDRSTARPQGTLVRPRDGVQHPDLDKAWTQYDAAVANVTESIKASIAAQFDAAAAKGDLDAAEKWQVIGEKFEKAGELPVEKETKAATCDAVADYQKAREELAKAYEAVVKALTMERKIADAKGVRGESLAISVAKKEEAIDLPELPTSKKKNAGDLRQFVFLSDLEEQEVSVTAGSGWQFGKNGALGHPHGSGAIFVRGVAAKKGLSMHPGSGSVSAVSYKVPEDCFRFEAKVALADSSVGQRSPVVFEVGSGEKVLWKSRPLQGAGVSEVCAIVLKGSKTIVLRARCVGDNFGAHAVWVDPRFHRK